MWRIFTKDLHEALASRRAWVALVALPLLLIGLVGQLSTRASVLRTYIDPAPAAKPEATRLRSLFADLQGVELVDEPRADRPVWSFMDETSLDVAVIWQPNAYSEASGAWLLYAQPLTPEEDGTLVVLTMAIQAGVKLNRVWWVGALSDSDAASTLNLQIIKRNGTPSPNSVWLVPRVIAIIVSVVAFLVAAPALARERELGTLPLLAIAPRVGWQALFLGKLILPLVAGISLLALSLIFAAALYRFGLKLDLPALLAVQALAVLAVSCQGLLVSALVRTQLQAYLAASAYVIALLLLTGALIPTGEGSVAVRLVANLFPLSFAMPPLAAWLSFGVPASRFGTQILCLAVQILVFGPLAGLAFWRLRRQF